MDDSVARMSRGVYEIGEMYYATGLPTAIGSWKLSHYFLCMLIVIYENILTNIREVHHIS